MPQFIDLSLPPKPEIVIMLDEPLHTTRSPRCWDMSCPCWGDHVVAQPTYGPGAYWPGSMMSIERTSQKMRSIARKSNPVGTDLLPVMPAPTACAPLGVDTVPLPAFGRPTRWQRVKRQAGMETWSDFVHALLWTALVAFLVLASFAVGLLIASWFWYK